MASMAFALPGKMSLDEAKRLANEFLGQHGQKFHDRHRSHGFTAMKVWAQQRPIQAAILYVEADNLQEAMKSFESSSHADDRVTHQLVEQITGQGPGQHGGGDGELVIDWHRDRGHAKTGV